MKKIVITDDLKREKKTGFEELLKTGKQEQTINLIKGFKCVVCWYYEKDSNAIICRCVASFNAKYKGIVGKAFFDEQDSFDIRFGARLALARCKKEIYIRIRREAVYEIKKSVDLLNDVVSLMESNDIKYGLNRVARLGEKYNIDRFSLERIKE